MSGLALGALVIGVLAGWALARLVARVAPRPAAGRTRDQELNHRIRSLETDLRITQRKAEELAAKLEKEREDVATRRQELESGLSNVKDRDEEITRLRKTLAEECAKTQELRLALTDHATETIRAQVRVKEVETELSVAHAGSTAVADEIRRLSSERDNLTDRIHALESEIAVRNSGTNVSPFPPRQRDR
jgi:chromosome segregation ATPase